MIATQQNNVPFQWVKYAVYLALLNNVYLFLVEELESAAALNTSITSVASVFQIFSTTIDTAAWLVLLLFFELETSVLSDQVLRGITGRFIRLIRFVCLITICIACWGYFAELYGLLARPWPFCSARKTHKRRLRREFARRASKGATL